MNNAQRRILAVGAIVLAAWIAYSTGWLSGVGIAAKVTAVTYVCDEKTAIPSEVQAALNELNERGIMATKFTDDETDGDNDVPEQYKVALPAAKAAGIPALVAQSGERVVRVVKAPTTKAQVLEAAQ